MTFWPNSKSGSRPSSAHSSPPPLQETLDEAAQTLGKTVKVELGRQAVHLQQLQQIAQDEINDVRRLKAKHLGGEWAQAAKKADDVGDMIICDDYHRNDRPVATGSKLVPLVLAAALGASGLGGAALLASLLLRPGAPAQSAPAQPVQAPAPAPKAQEWEVRLIWDGKNWSKQITPVK